MGQVMGLDRWIDCVGQVMGLDRWIDCVGQVGCSVE